MSVELAENAVTPPSPEGTAAPLPPPDARRRTAVGIGIVLVLQAAVIGWYVSQSWFLVDDFLFLRQAKDSSLDAEFLRLPLFEHFSPVHRLANWLFVRVDTPSWALATVILVALALACTAAFAYLVSSVSTSAVLVVGATAVYAVSLFFVRTAIWWTAGIHIMSVTLFSMLAIGGYIRWHRRRTLRSFVLSAVALALALLTHENAMLVFGVLVLLRLLVLAPHPKSLRDVVRGFRDDAGAWLVYLFLTALAAWNFATYYWQQQQRPGLRELARYLWMATGEGFFASLFLLRVPEAGLGSPTLTGVLAVLGGILVVGVTLVLRVGAWRVWVFFLISFAVLVAPLGLSRVAMFGATIGRDPVYQLAPAFLFLFSFVVAMSGAPRAPAGSRARTRGRAPSRAVVVGLVVVLVGAYGVAFARAADKTAAPTTSLADGPRRYFTNLRDDVRRLEDQGITPQLYNPGVPDAVVPHWLAPFDRLAINLMIPSIAAHPAHPGYVVTDAGRLVEMREVDVVPLPVASVAAAAGWSVDARGCAAALARSSPIVFQAALPDGAVIRMTGDIGPDTAVSIQVGTAAVPVTSARGAAWAYVPDGGGSVATIAVGMPPGSGCISGGEVAGLAAATGR